MKRIARKLKEKKINPSYQRIKIFEYLNSKNSHPAVDQIFQDLVKEMPTLSKTTVYNTLDLFKKAELVRVVTIEGNEKRYDIETSTHGHFKCEKCGRIYDFPIDSNALSSGNLKNFKITEKNVYFKGICPICSNKKK
ncbi:MAG: Fur family transcriptional regulator [Actinomycetota bacterium]|nr:Fur family transcriptional regulator [Actinomycetota bacterium]